LTARAEEYSEIAAFDIGADDYIIKPVKPRALLSRIKAMLKRELAEGTGTEKIVIEDLTINKQNYSIAVNNNSWVLPKKNLIY
jgi:two-component system alkaline phosphatase synthesis response regulator PhoP